MNLILAIFAGALGLVIGSFLNCLIWRMYSNETIGGRSYCPKCRKQIEWYDNIPVLSFLLLKAKCRHCHKPISWQYPLVEIMTAILFLVTFLNVVDQSQFALLLARDWLLIITLVIVFVYDLRWQLIPMNLVWPMCTIMFILNLLLGFSLFALLSSGILMAAFFLLQYVMTKKRGLGEGDIWLGLFLGLSFPGFSQLFLILFLTYCIGAVVGIYLMVSQGKSGKFKVALGPFLAFGAIITLIWGEQIIYWYLSLFS